MLSLKSRSAREREKSANLGFEVMSLSEIRKRKLREEAEGDVIASDSRDSTCLMTRYAPADTSMPESVVGDKEDEAQSAKSIDVSSEFHAQLRKRAHSPIVFDSALNSKTDKDDIVETRSRSLNEESELRLQKGEKTDSIISSDAGDSQVPLKRARRLIRPSVQKGLLGGLSEGRVLRRRKAMPTWSGESENCSRGTSDSGDGSPAVGTSHELTGKLERNCLGMEVGESVSIGDFSMDSSASSTTAPKSPSYINVFVERRDMVDSPVNVDSKDYKKDESSDRNQLDKSTTSLRIEYEDDDFLLEEQEIVTSTSIGMDEDIIQDIDEFLNN